MKKIALVLLLAAACEKAPQKVRPPVPVSIVQPIQCDVPLYRDYVAHLEANISVEVMGQVSGNLTGQYYVEGESVREGDLLLTIDSRPYVAALEKSEAILAQNLATLRQAREKTTRYAKLVQEEYVAQLSYDEYVTNVVVDEAIIQENKADIETAKINLDYCFIRAPMDSIAGRLQLKVGNYIDKNSNTTLLTLNQTQPMLAQFYVPEDDFPRIRALQCECPLKTEIFRNGDFTCPYEGVLTLIDNQVDQSTGTIFMQATLPNEDQALWPGEFVNIRVYLETKKEALLIPSQAVQIGQEGHFIYVIRPDHTAELRPITVGQREGDLVIIESGLCMGEQVVLEGQFLLYPDAKVAL